MKRKLELKFNLEDWLSILSSLNLKETDPESGDFSPGYKKEIIARNEEKKIFQAFYDSLKQKRTENKDIIREARINSKPNPFPELIDVPETKNNLVARNIWSLIEAQENNELYGRLLEANNVPNYQKLVWGISDQRRRDNVVMQYDFRKNEDSYICIFQSAIMMCRPCDVQNAFEYFAEEYSKLESIDSKKESEEKKNEILSSFHKSLRQTDVFSSGHIDSIIYNLWHVTDIPIRIFITVTEHVKEMKVAQ